MTGRAAALPLEAPRREAATLLPHRSPHGKAAKQQSESSHANAGAAKSAKATDVVNAPSSSIATSTRLAVREA